MRRAVADRCPKAWSRHLSIAASIVSVLKERYAAIWALADSGATLEQMARSSGQPVGQIELILGLRRQIDGNSTTIPHAPHA